MTGERVSFYWRICWKFVTPLMMATIFIYSMFVSENPRYSGLEFPPSLIILGWVIFSLGLLQVPIWAVFAVVQKKRANKSTVAEAVRECLKPSAIWGPKNSKRREKWLAYKKDAIELRNTCAADNRHSKIHQKINILFGNYYMKK
jgi:solute carrier family 6 (neurotransmitter transporter, glycine) member 5/9